MKDDNSFDNLDIRNLNVEEDTMYFTDIDKEEYEKDSKTYKEEDMYENYKPLTNTNSVEYDEGDYASPLYGADREESDENKKVIFAYIFTLLVIVLIIAVAVISINK